MNRFYHWLDQATYRRWMQVLWLVALAFFGWKATELKPDFEFESLFPQGHPDLLFYENHRQHFGYDNDYLAIILEHPPGIFHPDFLQKTKNLTRDLTDLEGTLRVVSLTNAKTLLKGPMGWTPVAVVHPENPEFRTQDSLRVYGSPLWRRLLARDRPATMLLLAHDHFADQSAASAFLQEVENAVGLAEMPSSQIVGKLSAQAHFIHLIRTDFLVFLVAALVVGLLLLRWLMKRWRAAWLPYAVSVSALVILLGTMGLCGQQITILGALIPPVILFVSTSDAIHLLNAYLRQPVKQAHALRVSGAVKEVLRPTLLTSLTTAIGFLSLISIPIAPIRQLGIWLAVGVLLAFVITFTWGTLLLFRNKEAVSESKHFIKWADGVMHYRRHIVMGFGILLAISIWGVLRIQTDATLLGDLAQNDPIRQQFAYADRHFAGSKPWELAIWPTNVGASVWSAELMTELEKADRAFVQFFPEGQLTSPLDLVKLAKSTLYENPGYDPIDASEWHRILSMAHQMGNYAGAQSWIAPDTAYVRMTGFIPELGSKETLRRNHTLKQHLENTLDPAIVQFRITGTTYLIDQSHHLITRYLFQGLCLAIAVTALLLGLYFRSWKILIVSLLVNLIPLVLTAGLLGWMGLSLQLTSSIIFVIAFGIAVDDTIHFITIYQLHSTLPVADRIRQTFAPAGKPILHTTLIIVAGFALFLFSQFGATFLMGLLLCTALLAALLTDLLLLPALLTFLENKSTHKELNKHG